MSEGIAVLLGAVVGGGCSLVGTYFTLRFHSKIEIKKLNLSFLMEKRGLIERCSSFDYSGNMEEDERNVIDEYKVISEFIYQKSHYFIESNEFQKLQNSLFSIENDNDYSPIERVYQENFFNGDFHKFIRKELESTMILISKEIRN
ncbi:hypothetical protein EZS27_021895 [termite gut metagenome]|uniref:Uncharacterized protein n=1 Tax=termite gut metagenome TaxID=433724 RepID=A0A5J4R7J4_9ZZZZ